MLVKTDKIKYDDSMEKNVFAYMEQWNMIEPGSLVIAGVSGGADSMCMLGILLKYRKKRDFELVVVHVNHGIRGGEAYQDEIHVRDFCDARGLRFEAVRIDVPQLAARLRISEEEAGRKARYEAFYEAAEKYRMQGQEYKIAVAHHKKDLAETVLFNLARGSGIRGAAGILPVNGAVVRPLLCCDKKEITEWLSEEGISYVEDSTNEKLDYSRNRMRQVVLPCLEENINSGAVDNLCNFAGIMGQALHYLTTQAEAAGNQAVRRYGDIIWLADDFSGIEPVLQGMLIPNLIGELAESKKDITFAHTRLVTELFTKPAGTQISLIHNIVAKKGYSGVYLFGRGTDIYSAAEIREREFGNLPLDCGDRVHFETVGREKNIKFPIKNYTKYFDCDKIKGNLCVRKRNPGDYLIISESGGKKTIKSYLIEQKVPRELRQRLTVVADGSHVLWVVGLRDSAGCRVTESTRRVLKVWLEDDIHGEGAGNGEEL